MAPVPINVNSGVSGRNYQSRSPIFAKIPGIRLKGEEEGKPQEEGLPWHFFPGKGAGGLETPPKEFSLFPKDQGFSSPPFRRLLCVNAKFLGPTRPMF